jgi:hypothetical protein
MKYAAFLLKNDLLTTLIFFVKFIGHFKKVQPPFFSKLSHKRHDFRTARVLQKKSVGLFGLSVPILNFFLFWKHLVRFSTIRSHESVYQYTTDNTIFMEFSRNTEVLFISCRRIKGRERGAKPTFNSQQFVVTHTINHTEISALLDSWVTNTPSVKILCPQAISCSYILVNT